MRISANVINSQDKHKIILKTNENVHELEIASKPTGYGSSANGGELLFLALATCYVNDIYREAAKKGIKIERVEVEVAGEFDYEGAPAKNVTYKVRATSDASESDILELMRLTDTVAEIQNTLRQSTPVTLVETEVVKAQ